MRIEPQKGGPDLLLVTVFRRRTVAARGPRALQAGLKARLRIACERCVIHNSSIIESYGTGAEAVIAPEMQAFEQRFNFRFLAHEKGDANRSAKVERE